MFDFMLDAAAQIRQVPHETVSEKLAVGGEVTLRGMGTVFAVLILIWIIVEILHVLLSGFSGNKEATPDKQPVEVASASAPAETVSAPEAVPAPVPVANDYELIAVITAAVAAASGSAPTSFRVVSFKRANNKFSGGK